MQVKILKAAIMSFIVIGCMLAAPPSAFAEVIRADDSAVDSFSDIPDNWIAAVKNNLVLYNLHQSHGSHNIQGMKMIYTDDNKYYPPEMWAQWWLYPNGCNDIGWNGDTCFVDWVRDYLDTNSVGCNIVTVSFSHAAHSCDYPEMLKFMAGWYHMAQDYPNVNFVVQTARLRHDPEDFETIGMRYILTNQYMRDICDTIQLNNIFLFDDADISWWDRRINQIDSMATDSGNTWMKEYVQSGYTPLSCVPEDLTFGGTWHHSVQGNTESCSHSYGGVDYGCLMCDLTCKAWWWMMARVAGWDGGTQVNHRPEITSPSEVDAYMDSLFYYSSTAFDQDNHEIHFSYINYPDWMTVDGQNISGMARTSDVDTSFSVIASDGQLADTNLVSVTVWSITPCGDTNRDRSVDLGDVVFIINYIFRGGNPPKPETNGDPNHDFDVNVADAVYLVNYIFKGGPDPNCP